MLRQILFSAVKIYLSDAESLPPCNLVPNCPLGANKLILLDIGRDIIIEYIKTDITQPSINIQDVIDIFVREYYGPITEYVVKQTADSTIASLPNTTGLPVTTVAATATTNQAAK